MNLIRHSEALAEESMNPVRHCEDCKDEAIYKI